MGLSDKLYLRVLGALLDLSPEFNVDLVNVDEAPKRIYRIIESEGMFI